MKILSVAFLAFCACAQVTVAHAAQVEADLVQRGQPLTVEVTAGIPHSIMLDEAPGAVVVGNPEIADVNIVGSRSIVIIPKKIGVTGLIVTDKNGKLISSLTVPVNDPSTVAIWNAGVRESLWCSAESCLSDKDVANKNANIESVKADDKTLAGLLLGVISSKNGAEKSSASGAGAGAAAGTGNVGN